LSKVIYLFIAENCRKSQKIVIITSTPGEQRINCRPESGQGSGGEEEAACLRLRRQPHGALEAVVAPGIDFILRFIRKDFGQIFVLKLRTKFNLKILRKTVDKILEFNDAKNEKKPQQAYMYLKCTLHIVKVQLKLISKIGPSATSASIAAPRRKSWPSTRALASRPPARYSVHKHPATAAFM
jgi:hypothetical protein